ncbi:hypothetical protein DFR67_111185 [Williamsia limnetica]|uniref:PknH-like protein n=1 Tax=Williamsia limnetica TaxID=882452 RepID=A0A318REU1_WILLI|nr:hypothetical protein [Williamsia limnetica]PYE15109.1 hypothetical protein DFR67_111185 [Williamsia limnetica]
MLRKRVGVPVIVLATVCLVSSACGADADPAPSSSSQPGPFTPAGALLPAREFPSGYQRAELGIADMREQNAAALAAASTAQFDPSRCRPTADVTLNEQLDPSNAALSAWQTSSGNSIIELVTTVSRDIDADIRVNTGECARVTITVTTGSTAGTTVVTENQRLSPPPLPTSLSVLVKSVATTTYPGGKTAAAQTLAGYAVVDGVTVQLVAVSTQDGLTDAAFAELFARAVAKVAGAAE